MRYLSLRITITLIITSGILIAFLLSKNKLETYVITSPDEQIKIEFFVEKGNTKYTLFYKKDTLVYNASFSIELKGMRPFKNKFEIIDIKNTTVAENWAPYEDTNTIEDSYKQLTIKLREKTRKSRQINIHLRVYNDGIAYQYEFPLQTNLKIVELINEKAEFTLKYHDLAWWAGNGNYGIFSVSDTINNEKTKETERSIPGLNFPLTLKAPQEPYISFAEIINFSSTGTLFMNVQSSKGKLLLQSNFESTLTKAKTPSNTPWRIIYVSSNPSNMLKSNLALNVNKKEAILNKPDYDLPSKFFDSWWKVQKSNADSIKSNDTLRNMALKILIYKASTDTLITNPDIKGLSFLKNIPATWDQTIILEAEIDKYITIARKKDDTWYIGSLNNMNTRELIIPLHFLSTGKTYKSDLQTDTLLKYDEATFIDVSKETIIKAKIPRGGGLSFKIQPTENF